MRAVFRTLQKSKMELFVKVVNVFHCLCSSGVVLAYFFFWQFEEDFKKSLIGFP